jgi:LacI family transcriptional regulator
MGLLRAAFDMGLDVPRDLAVVSFDGIDYAAYTRPGLTTVSQPITEMAEVATQLLIDALGGGTIPPGTRSLPTELVRRGSCGCSDDFAGAATHVNAGDGGGS